MFMPSPAVNPTMSATNHEEPPSPPVEVARRIVLLVDEIHAIRNLPVVLADRLGYLRSGPMDVTVMNLRYDAAHADMLRTGRVDAVMAYYHHNVVNRSKGFPTKAIVTLGVTPGMKVLVRNDARGLYRTPADLKGSRIITGGARSAKATLANWLVLQGGHQLCDYSPLPTGTRQAILAALATGAADLVVAPTPDGDFYEASGKASVFADLTTAEAVREMFGALFPTSTVFMASHRIDAYPDFARHLAEAFVRTLRFMNSHTVAEIADLVPDAIAGEGVEERARYQAILAQALPMFDSDGVMPVDGAEAEFGVLRSANPDYAQFEVDETYTNEFVAGLHSHAT
jgi:NitT/TauT family transport system substrate-binding protein